ncbi:2Fe-2S iron-sulfur cluster-binding protein [Sneathiella marina]|uniref:2Fe-2S iron-sulfur cluster-binding protein n=1 Tax=Sneathiella marina TaxID=2950108 RepID=A0ABY4W5B4_9PROT|nr:2Fe-2S iron-sulfur cluster-binding protein [Sneathiella marina]USG60484.1 2Fe-2S iron-sulfur cluster-binding protein [Sneathiella marina]
MVKVTYISTDGTETDMDVAEGTSLMQAAVSSGLDGVIGECGGSAMCATCHVYVDASFLEKLPAIDDMEEEMLECTSSDRRPTSRLSCQIESNSDIDGIRVTFPETQV